MEFLVHQESKYGDMVIEGRYTFPDGKRKSMRQRIENRAMVESPSVVDFVKEGMIREAEREVHDYVRNNAERLQAMPIQYTQAVNPMQYYTTAAGSEPSSLLYSWRMDDVTTAGTCEARVQYWANDNCVPNTSAIGLPENFSTHRIKITYKDGNKKLIIEKDANDGEMEVTPEDIMQARANWYKGMKLQIITKKAETKAEDLLKMFISEIDFRNYKQKGFFTVRSGNKIFRIWKDNHKQIDMYQKEGGLFVPKNRLCVHTAERELPLADEALAKLMLIKSNRVFDQSNAHSASDLKPIKNVEELVLV